MTQFSHSYEHTPSGLVRDVSVGRYHDRSEQECLVDEALPLSNQWWRNELRGVISRGSIGGAVRTADLFCGPGGLSVGARIAITAAGLRHESLAAVDVDAEALSVYAQNFSPRLASSVNVASIVDYHVYGRGSEAELAYEPEIIDDRFQELIGNVDLLLAGPPCQGHSNLNNHSRRSDPRNVLYVTTAVAGIALRARAMVIENVPEVTSDRSQVVQSAHRVLEAAGYSVSAAVLNAADIGGAQSRRRHFTIATLKSPHVAVSTVASALKQPPMTLREIIGDLEDWISDSFLDEEPDLSPVSQARIDYLFDHDLFDLPNSQRPECHREGHTYPSVYGRLSWEKPSQTITTGFMTAGRGRFIHPSRRRTLTPREAARIQGFPDGYDFSVSGVSPTRRSLAKWIGDAVPSWLGYAATLSALSGL